MKLNAERIEGTNAIARHGKDGVMVNGVQFTSSVVVPWTGLVTLWPVARFADLNTEHFAALAQHEPELILFGSGEKLRRDVAAGADMANLKSAPTALAVILAVLIYPMTLIPPPSENFPVGGYFAMFFIMMVSTLLSPLLLRVLQRVYQRPSELLLGMPGRLAADNFARAPVRTAVPVSALSIGVGMTICIAA